MFCRILCLAARNNGGKNKTNEVRRVQIIAVIATLPLIFIASILLSVTLFSSNLLGIQILISFVSFSIITSEIIFRAVERPSKPKGSGAKGIGFDVKAVPFLLRDKSDSKSLTGPYVEALVSVFFERAGYEVIRQRKQADQGFDIIALKGNTALVVEIKNRVATTPDLTSLIGAMQIAHFPIEVQNKRMLPMLVADKFTESVRTLATDGRVTLLPFASLTDPSEIDRVIGKVSNNWNDEKMRGT